MGSHAIPVPWALTNPAPMVPAVGSGAYHVHAPAVAFRARSALGTGLGDDTDGRRGCFVPSCFFGAFWVDRIVTGVGVWGSLVGFCAFAQMVALKAFGTEDVL